MKKIIITLALAFSVTIGYPQKVIELNEAQVNFNPITSISAKGNSFSVKIKETAQGEFEKDPLAFMDKYFDINQVIDEIGNKRHQSYQVSFRSRKGEMNAEFDNKGNLLSTYLKFSNVLVPYELKHQLYRDYKGWAMIKNQHIAKGRNGKVKSDFYRITMKNGNKKKNLKIDSPGLNRGEVAFN